MRYQHRCRLGPQDRCPTGPSQEAQETGQRQGHQEGCESQGRN